MNSIAASAAMARPARERPDTLLALRILSALVLIPIVLFAVWVGGWAFYLLVGVFAALMLQEWHRMTVGRRGWLLVGLIYIGLPCLALIWLRDRHIDGLGMLLWILGVVWSADTGAYFAGRAIGGPKLAPRLSPNKTWAGLFGGIFLAALFGAIAVQWIHLASLPVAILASAILAGIAEMGDLAESAAKRHFGVKDSGALIPGHGGALDRLDSLLFAAPAAVLLLSMIQGGQAWR